MKVLYFTENQRDWLSEDQPNDKLNRLLHPGQDKFGFPYCDGGDIPDSQFGWRHSCNEFTKPIAQLGPHSAPLGMRFYTGKMFPKEYHTRSSLLATDRGTRARKSAVTSSWRRSPRTEPSSRSSRSSPVIQNNNYV